GGGGAHHLPLTQPNGFPSRPVWMCTAFPTRSEARFSPWGLLAFTTLLGNDSMLHCRAAVRPPRQLRSPHAQSGRYCLSGCPSGRLSCAESPSIRGNGAASREGIVRTAGRGLEGWPRNGSCPSCRA